MKLLRFISKEEYNTLQKDKIVFPKDTGRAWSGKKRLFAFPIGPYKDEEYYKIKDYLEIAYDIDYDYAIYIDNGYDDFITFAAYDKEMVDMTIGKDVTFDVDNDLYDSGPVYVVPEVRLVNYKIEDVSLVMSLNNLKESTKQMTNLKFESFAQFIKAWRDNPLSEVENFRQMLEDLSMTEDMEIDYNKLPVQVSFTKMPIIVDGIATVKVVAITQADNFALVIPDEIYKAYEALEESPSEISSINMGIQLIVDSAGFDTGDSEFQKMVQRAYVGAAGSSTAYELSSVVKASVEDETEEEETDRGLGLPGSQTEPESQITKEPEPMFDSPQGIEFPEEISKNAEAYSKFSKSTNALEKLLEKLRKSPEIVKENIKVNYLGETKNILCITVDNKSIYKSFINIPKKAKDTLTKFGESLRLNEDTQIVDTFTKEGNRTFIIAEYVGNNFWLVENEDISEVRPGGKLVIPKSYIKLQSSSVRSESRKFKPIKYEGKIVFHLNK